MVNDYQHKKLWKYTLFAFAIVIAGGSLLYTRALVKHIERTEYRRAQIWALSMQQVTSADDNDFLPYVLAVRDSSIVPSIMTDEKGDIISSKGLDTTKTWIAPDQNDINISLDQGHKKKIRP